MSRSAHDHVWTSQLTLLSSPADGLFASSYAVSGVQTSLPRFWADPLVLSPSQTRSCSLHHSDFSTDLKISISERTVFNAMHLDAVDAFNTCSDIKSVCWTLYDTSKRLESKVSSLLMREKAARARMFRKPFS